MNNKDILKLHKGIDNQLRFVVANPDYKKVSVSHLDIKAILVNRVTREKVLEKYLKQTDTKGMVRLEVLEAELIDIPRGYYELVIRGENPHAYAGAAGASSFEGFYRDHAGNITFDVEITAQGDTRPFPSVFSVVKDWTPSYEGNQPAYISQALPANVTRNTNNRVHTFALTGENATGIVRVYGSLERTASTNDNDWFRLDIPSGNDPEILLDKFTGIDAWSFQANLSWIRLKWIPNPTDAGKLISLTYRN